MRKHLPTMFRFGLVGASGIVVNTLALYLLRDHAGLAIPVASAIATELAIISNFLGNHNFTFRFSRNPAPPWQKFLKFQLVSLIALVCTVGVLTFLVHLFGDQLYLVWNLFAIGVAFAINFVLNLKFTWHEPSEGL